MPGSLKSATFNCGKALQGKVRYGWAMIMSSGCCRTAASADPDAHLAALADKVLYGSTEYNNCSGTALQVLDIWRIQSISRRLIMSKSLLVKLLLG